MPQSWSEKYTPEGARSIYPGVSGRDSVALKSLVDQETRDQEAVGLHRNVLNPLFLHGFVSRRRIFPPAGAL